MRMRMRYKRSRARQASARGYHTSQALSREKKYLTKPNRCEEGPRIDFVPLQRVRCSIVGENAVSDKLSFRAPF